MYSPPFDLETTCSGATESVQQDPHVESFRSPNSFIIIYLFIYLKWKHILVLTEEVEQEEDDGMIDDLLAE